MYNVKLGIACVHRCSSESGQEVRLEVAKSLERPVESSIVDRFMKS